MSQKKHGQKTGNASHRIEKGPEPERLKITGVKRWEDAVSIAMRKKKPAGGWPGRSKKSAAE
jgi:hypothetical protein